MEIENLKSKFCCWNKSEGLSLTVTTTGGAPGGDLEPVEYIGNWKTIRMSVELGQGPSNLREALKEALCKYHKLKAGKWQWKWVELSWCRMWGAGCVCVWSAFCFTDTAVLLPVMLYGNVNPV